MRPSLRSMNRWSAARARGGGRVAMSFRLSGPVIGMAILFVYLVARGGPDRSLDATAAVRS